MISYSDYVLANRPWAYWPLNDPDLNVYNEAHLLMDVTGNERHLSMGYNIPSQQNGVSLAFNDSVPIRGIRAGVSGSSSSMSSCHESSSRIWLASGDHTNDVSPEMIYSSHIIWSNRVRAEFLMTHPPQATYGCTPMMYPILSIAGISLWVHTWWFEPCVNCACIAGASNLILAANTSTHCYYGTYHSYQSQSTPIHWFPYFINSEGETVRISKDAYEGPLYDSTGTGMLIKHRRVIVDVTYLSDKSLMFSVIFDDGTKAYSVSNMVFSLPASFIDYRGWTCSTTLTYPSDWTEVTIYGGPTISNLSVYYNNALPLTYNYIPLSWQALTSFQPNSNSNIVQLSDNVNSSRIVDIHPNSMLAQLDTMLCRGMSHRIIFNLTATNDNGYSEIRLIMPHSFTASSEVPLHDFSIGDMISLQGSSQNLNSVWKIESIDKSSVSFTVPGTFTDESSVMLVKRPPVRRRCLGKDTEWISDLL